jgi:TatD DNase family protein
MIDAHVHLDKYGEQLPKALRQIRAKSIFTLAVSMDVDSFNETRRIAEADPLILPAFGVHPWEAHRFASDLSVLEATLEEASVYGEIGLDFHFVRDESFFAAQRTVFEFFLDAAEQNGRLINVHTKGAESAVLETLTTRTLPAVIVHWYSGPLDLVDEYLGLGAYFTVGVEVLRSELIQSLAARLPFDRILTETDNPGAWDWMEGEVGFPELIEQVEEAVAEARGMSRGELSAQVERNFQGVLQAGGVGV